MEHALSIADSADLSISEIDPDEMGADGVMFKTLVQRKSNLAKTAEILATHDVVVQKLINKARDDLGEYVGNFDAIRKWVTEINTIYVLMYLHVHVSF